MNLETKIKPLLKKMRTVKWFIRGESEIRTGIKHKKLQCPLTFFADMPGVCVEDYREAGRTLRLTYPQSDRIAWAADFNSKQHLRKLLLRAAGLKQEK